MAEMKLGGIAIGVLMGLPLSACDSVDTPVSAYRSNHVRFDAAIWREDNDRVQGAMVKDLLERELLHGMDKSQVEQLLGPADKDVEHYLGYVVDLGTRFGSTVWPYYLNIDFSEQNGLFAGAIVSD